MVASNPSSDEMLLLATAASALTAMGSGVKTEAGSPMKTGPALVEALEGLALQPPPRQNSTAHNELTFPQRLMFMLSDPRLTKVASWLPSGCAFVAFQPTDLAAGIRLPNGGTMRFSSFVRKLLRWGFQRTTRSHDAWVFTHPLFQRDQPHLCKEMVSVGKDEKKSHSSHRQVKGLGCIFPSTEHILDNTASRLYLSPFQQESTVLTAEAIQTMQAQSGYSYLETKPSVVSEASSESNSMYGDSPTPKTVNHMAPTLKAIVCHDLDFVGAILRQMEEAERLNAARCCLLQNFLQAMETK